MYEIRKENGELLTIVDKLRFVSKNSKGVKILSKTGKALSVDGEIYRLSNEDFLEYEKVSFSLVPAELREQAYNTEKIIEFNNSTYTITEAATLWMYYSVEGSEKANEIAELVTAAKKEIRDKYPD